MVDILVEENIDDYKGGIFMLFSSEGSKKIYENLFENFSIILKRLGEARVKKLPNEQIQKIEKDFSQALNILVDFIKAEAEKMKVQKESFAT